MAPVLLDDVYEEDKYPLHFDIFLLKYKKWLKIRYMNYIFKVKTFIEFYFKF